MSVIRWILRWIILFADRVTTPKSPDHPPELQARLDSETQTMILYEFEACPFCVKTRRAIKRLGLNIETRDAKKNEKWKTELINHGGRYQVPCLKIDDSNNKSGTWMYESNEIIEYLNCRFNDNYECQEDIG